MVYYRTCPKCRGDMHTREDSYGNFRECIQCGLIQDLRSPNKLKESAGNKKDEAA
jgi:DNA-directed RNA polymerase subunit M/transcription elongation factor TFIIS